MTIDPMPCDVSKSDLATINHPDALASAARTLGLKPVRAWVPEEQPKPTSDGATRTRRARERAEGRGLKQLSVTLPADLHPLVKELATRTKAGETSDSVLRSLTRSIETEAATGKPDAGCSKGTVVVPVLPPLSGWRKWLVMLLLPRSVRSVWLSALGATNVRRG